MLKLNRLAIIPARGGSKRIKNKNLVNFDGKPIISYTINNAKKSKLFDKIHISTDSKKILSFSKKLNVHPEFKRPTKLSGDKVILSEILKFVVNEFKKKKVFFNEVWLLYSCSPLISHKDLILASKAFNKTKKKYPMMSIREYDIPIEWAFKKNNNILEPISKKSLALRSQDIKKSYHESASFVIFKTSQLFKKSNFKHYGYELKKNFAIDIDTEEDLDIAKALHKNNKNR
ncbi:acylneuraminate cytidylyltransferase family protein [Candidatus Pelagibacter sp.]|jgi:pseudaminic acid cytidylyltransferase|nr:acylneuraminate cytidylyltransferase family protein [Candidatus Pelagibacter sp.]